MKTITAAVDDRYVEALDSVLRSSGLYSSRSEFIKDAVRSKIAELAGFEEALKRVRKVKAKLRGKVKFVRELSQKERDELAKKCIEKHYR